MNKSTFWETLELKLFPCLLLCSLMLSCSQTSQNPSDSPLQLRLASFTPGSSWYVYGARIGQLLQKSLPENPTVQVLPFAGAIGNPNLLRQGKADLALMFDVTAQWAEQGIVAFDTPFPNLRTLASMIDQYYVVIISPENFPVENIADIVQKQVPTRLYTLPVGSQGELLARLIFETHSASYKDLQKWGGSVQHTSFYVIKSAFRDNRIDLFIHGITLTHPAITEVALMTDIKFLKQNKAKLQQLASQYGFQQVSLPAKNFRRQTNEVDTIGYQTVLATSSQLPEDLAYHIVKAVVEGRQFSIQSKESSTNSHSPSSSQIKRFKTSLHPGASRYYKEMGLLH